MCRACGNLLRDIGPHCRDCLPQPATRTIPDACNDCHISETACAGIWALENTPCCDGCSHG